MKILISSNFKKHFNTHVDFIDHYWVDFFEKKNVEFKLVPNSIKNLKKILINEKNVKLIIIPGGNDLFKNKKLTKIRFKVEEMLIKHSLKKRIPLLGVCRGMQIMNYHFGGRISPVKNHMKKRTKIYFSKNFFDKKEIKVKCFHNYGIKNSDVSKEFKILAVDKNKNIEMFEHKKKKMIGVMWHPEREINYYRLNKIINKLKI